MVIIGGGPGGYAAALYAHNFGLSVALVEKDKAVHEFFDFQYQVTGQDDGDAVLTAQIRGQQLSQLCASHCHQREAIVERHGLIQGAVRQVALG